MWISQQFSGKRSNVQDPMTQAVVENVLYEQKPKSWSRLLLYAEFFYWRSISLYGRVERHWTVYRYDEDSVLWKLCEEGDLVGFQQALSNGASPYILRKDPSWSSSLQEMNLLHVRCHAGIRQASS